MQKGICVSLSEKLVKEIDSLRGDVPRSKFLERIIIANLYPKVNTSNEKHEEHA
jgi:metal-responsive CopG/Arc/MetJ family transcriptional regulator